MYTAQIMITRGLRWISRPSCTASCRCEAPLRKEKKNPQRKEDAHQLTELQSTVCRYCLNYGQERVQSARRISDSHDAFASILLSKTVVNTNDRFCTGEKQSVVHPRSQNAIENIMLSPSPACIV